MIRRLSILLLLAALPLGACGGGGDTGAAGDLPGAPDAAGGDASLGDDTAAPSADAGDASGPVCEADGDCLAGAEAGPCGVPRCVEGACVEAPRPDGTPCDDDDACTRETLCLAGACGGGQPTTCADDDPCTADTCDASAGCLYEPVPADQACDDGDPCTLADRCSDGACLGDPDPACACSYDADCDAFQDQDACNGELRCLAGHCATAPGSPVTCPDPGTCRVAACVSGTGACRTLLAPDGAACSDGNPCTAADACVEGVCSGEVGGCACDSDADCAAFQQDDYDLCQGPLVCLDGVCAPDPEQRVTCDAEPEGACVTTACESSTGLCATVARADGAACSAVAGACEAPGVCHQGQCATTGPPCDDGNPCTEDVCAAAGCQHIAAPGPCDDGDPCTSGEACEAAECVGGKPVSCDDLNPCTADTCSPAAGGCASEPLTDGTPCGAGDPCFGEGACLAGQCAGQEPAECASPGPCATATCVPGEGCVAKPAKDGAPCDDGDPCTDGGTCQGGACVAMPLSCNDDNPCTLEHCDPASGGCVQEPVEDGSACTSADPCVEGATCLEGACGGGEPVECADGPCATRGCDPLTGACVVTGQADDGSPCGGGDPCSQVGTCKAGTCAGSTPVDCDDGNACTLDGCVPSDGSCAHEPVKCVAPAGDACTASTCYPDAGCVDVVTQVCQDADVLWSSSVPCDGEGWSFEGSGGGPGFVIDDVASPAGPWDGDCSLHLSLPGGAGSGWSADARAALPEIPAGAVLTVHFVEWWSGATKEVGAVRQVGLADGEGEILAVAAVPKLAGGGPGWTERQVTLSPAGSAEGAVLVFRVEATPPTSEAAWYVDRVVVTTGE